MKDNTILIVAAVAAGGYLIFKSDIAKNIGQVGSGVGEAVGGLGSGIGQIGTAAGSAAEGFAYGVNSVLDLLNPLGALGNQVAGNINATGETQTQTIYREAEQVQQVDTAAFEKAFDPLVDIQAARDLFAAEKEAERSGMKEENKNQWTGYLTQADDVIVNWAKAGSVIPFANAQNVFSWVKSQVSSVFNRDPEPVVSVADTTSSSSLQSIPTSSSSSSSSSDIVFSGDAASDIKLLPAGSSFTDLPYIDPVEPAPTIYLSQPSTLEKIGSFFLKNFTFF